MNLAAADKAKLPALLDQLARAVEDLLLTGLTTASETTRQALNVAFQEASRMRLLRLGGTLRLAGEELSRFTRNDADFSRKRLLFFLNRAWLLSTGLAQALRSGDEAKVERLLRTPTPTPVDRLELVTLGVSKKVATGAFVAFDFRMRPNADAGIISAGQRLVWSFVFPVKAGQDLPPEAFLHLPQKQKFNASQLLDGKTVVVEKAAVTLDESSGRISLGEQSTFAPGTRFDDWQRFQTWDPAAALQRIQAHEPGPFDVDVELQEEVCLKDWQIGEPTTIGDNLASYPIVGDGLQFDGLVSTGPEGKALRKALEEQRKHKKRLPLFGLMHYEKCRLKLQPLAVFGSNGPEHLTLSTDKIDRAALLKMIKF
jgi:hypothetical protein